MGIQSIADLFKALLKLGLVALAVKIALGAAWHDIMALSQQPAVALLFVVKKYAVKLLLTAGGCYLVLAALQELFRPDGGDPDHRHFPSVRAVKKCYAAPDGAAGAHHQVSRQRIEVVDADHS
jgi:hypothetical protein